MALKVPKHSSVFSAAALLGIAAIGIAGCSNDAAAPSTTDSTGHAIGWRDTPPLSKAPPANQPGNAPVNMDGSSSYAQPTNPLPAGGLPPQAPPKAQ